MMLALALLAVFPLQAQADGLREGESLVALAPTSAAQRALEEVVPFRSGRVVDAFSGMPIAGATVEAWSEEITESTHGLRRIGEATTRASGQFEIRVREGDVLAEKARVRATGYATLSTVAGDLTETLNLFPIDAAPTRLRLVDPDGRPIVDSRITSTRTCAHDVPAFTLVPDAQGIFTFPELAYQDELPELRLLAPGYLGVKYFNTERLFRRPPSDGPLEIILPPAAHPQIRLIDATRRAIANRALLVLDSGDHQVVRTNGEGRVRMLGRYECSSVDYAYLEDQSRQFAWAAAWMSAFDREFVLMHDDGDWDEDAELGTVQVDLPDGIPEEAWVGFDLVHADGWQGRVSDRSDPEWQSDFPVGTVSMGWGGPFEQLLPGHMEVELTAGSTTALKPALEFAVELSFERPDGVSRIWCEVDGLSKALEYNDDDVWLPRARPWRIGFTYQGQDWTHAMEPIDGSTELDLAGLLPDRKELPMAAVEVVFPPDTDLDAADCWPWVVADWDEEIPDPERTEQGWILRGPTGHSLLFTAEAEGCLDRWGRIQLPMNPSQRTELAIDFVPSAELDLQIPEEWSVVSGPDASEPLPPATTEFVIEDGDGNRYGLVLQLQPGEARTVTIE